MEAWKKKLILALVLLYLLLPDLFPGPIDDILMLLLTTPILRDGGRPAD